MKKLVSASTVRECRDSGQTTISAPQTSTIVTPEARDLAAKWSIAIDSGASPAILTDKGPEAGAAEQIQKQISASLPPGSADSGLIEQLVRKALQDMEATDPASSCQRQVADNGVVLVRGNSVEMGRFDGAPDHNIGLADVITGADKSRMSAGYMSWEDAFFPWTLTYDEIDVVLEGELHIRAGGKTYIGKPGDVFFIPSGASIEFGTPSSVRFVYVTYPANWAAE